MARSAPRDREGPQGCAGSALSLGDKGTGRGIQGGQDKSYGWHLHASTLGVPHPTQSIGEWRRSPTVGMAGGCCWYMPLYSLKPLEIFLRVMALSLMGGGRDTALLSTCSLGLVLTWHSPGILV